MRRPALDDTDRACGDGRHGHDSASSCNLRWSGTGGHKPNPFSCGHRGSDAGSGRCPVDAAPDHGSASPATDANADASSDSCANDGRAPDARANCGRCEPVWGAGESLGLPLLRRRDDLQPAIRLL